MGPNEKGPSEEKIIKKMAANANLSDMLFCDLVSIKKKTPKIMENIMCKVEKIIDQSAYPSKGKVKSIPSTDRLSKKNSLSYLLLPNNPNCLINR